MRAPVAAVGEIPRRIGCVDPLSLELTLRARAARASDCVETATPQIISHERQSTGMIEPFDNRPIIGTDSMRVSAAILEFIRDAKPGGLLPVDDFSRWDHWSLGLLQDRGSRVAKTALLT